MEDASRRGGAVGRPGHKPQALLHGIAANRKVVGFDLVEVDPMIDTTGQTALLATTATLGFLGAIFEPPR